MIKAVLFGLLAGFMALVAVLVPELRLVVTALGIVLGVLAIVWFGRHWGEEVEGESPLDKEIAEVRRVQRRS